ncbi:TPA: helix-turn-helix domain-containing protein [Aeromonas hydrophila]|uniref:helix-turn-helix domain-containing protein n=1 Tax=Aeromonas hydrophila TaxID=644 RepID=UPI001CCF248A|nr:helix-turn-helix domain-containing protein [Aeromonas hydrophila]EHK5438663.1 helix-turn-helix domain-containing protein [Aeromonas hydrophila]UBQ50856.1 helix-turn-helix domain-containing protein [Aeromonas hydrophila]HDI1215516.1 helix-turn-helix domain-containing protein [Aeromonas hydrophila]
MSMLLMVKAMSIKVGNPLRKLVLIKLADNSSDTGECWPSHQHIADQCEISRRSVITHIDALCETGLLKKSSRIGHAGKRSNMYILTLDSAGAAHPNVQEIHMVCAADAQTHSAGAAHRISHSLDPVIDPKIPPISPQGEHAAESSAPRRGTRLSNDWVLPSEWGRWAMRETGLPRERIILEAATFADYWQALPGAKAVKLDWEKTWRNWVRRAASSFRTAAQRKPLENLQAAQQAAKALRESGRGVYDDSTPL